MDKPLDFGGLPHFWTNLSDITNFNEQISDIMDIMTVSREFVEFRRHTKGDNWCNM